MSDKCGFRRGCKRDAAWVVASTAEKWNQLDPKYRGQLAVDALNCNVHGGMFRRRKYTDNRLIAIDEPMALPVVEAARNYRNSKAEAQAAADAESRAAANDRYAERVRRAWEELDIDFVVRAVVEENLILGTERKFEVVPRGMDDPPQFLVWPIDVDDRPDMPVLIAFRRTGTMTPKLARAMATALAQAADLAETENTKRKAARV